jgi:hypothetical protein
VILDAGIARFFHPAEQTPGGMINRDGILFHEGWYGDLTVGVTRYYTARQNNDRVDRLIRILRTGEWAEIGANDYCVLADGYRYRIVQVQIRRDEEAGEDVADVSVERTGVKDVGEDGP